MRVEKGARALNLWKERKRKKQTLMNMRTKKTKTRKRD